MIAVNSAESERPGNRELLAEITDDIIVTQMHCAWEQVNNSQNPASKAL